MSNRLKLTSIVKEVIKEISPELRQSAISKMKDRGQERRAEKWTQHYGTKDLDKFKDREFTTINGENLVIYSFRIEDPNTLHISYGSPRNKEFNRTQGTLVYNIKKDYFNIENVTRKTARLLGLIAATVNPNTKYKNGTGDFNIQGY